MSWKDRLLIKLMGNKLVIKIMSMPIVIKILTMETKAFLWVISLFKRKKSEAQIDQPQSPESGPTPPAK